MGTDIPSMMDLVIETHIGLERQGPGSPETILKALGFLDHPESISQVLDLGCGTGGQTLFLAKNIPGNIAGIDQFPDFINVLNSNAKKQGLQNRVAGIVGSMEALPFSKGEFDLIWSEGAIDNIGFKRGLAYWKDFLKKDGYVAVICPSWFTDRHPAEVEKFWADAGSQLDTVAHNIAIMQKVGYLPVATFLLPETCWTDHYFIPRGVAEKALLKKYGFNETVNAFLESNRYEVELYSKYKQYYGYAFYIGKKI